MNSRSFTNVIRYFMDEWIPPAIRDSKVFMFPFYYYAYKGRDIKKVMNLKATIFKWSEKEFADFYSNRDTRFSNSRETDMSKQCLKYVFEHIKSDNDTFLDVGCGNGFLLKYANEKGFLTTGCDIIEGKTFDHSDYYQANIENLPFEDNSFDVVCATHTLEHVIDFERAITELKRVTKKTLCVVVPCQRAYYYTLDEHVRFFPYKWMLEQEMKMDNYTCEKIHGDLVFIGDLEAQKENL
ncbi:class I SAM-dependent methyltransferase [Aquimarina sp. 433]